MNDNDREPETLGVWFRAPHGLTAGAVDERAHCNLCGLPIQYAELITEDGDNYLHERCVEEERDRILEQEDDWK